MGHKNVIQHRMPQVRRGTDTKIKESYFPREGPNEPRQCSTCKAVYHHKRWYLKDDSVAIELLKKPIEMTICPACRKTEDHFPGGVITLKGEYLALYKDQILHLIRNEEGRAKQVNPMEGIISIKDLGSSVEIHSTNERFAQKVAQAIKRAHKGEISYHWTHGDKFVRVEWQRETESK
ncbi:MAG: BCAM0308 family protein [Nitrospiria bacterium]